MIIFGTGSFYSAIGMENNCTISIQEIRVCRYILFLAKSNLFHICQFVFYNDNVFAKNLILFTNGHDKVLTLPVNLLFKGVSTQLPLLNLNFSFCSPF